MPPPKMSGSGLVESIKEAVSDVIEGLSELFTPEPEPVPVRIRPNRGPRGPVRR